MVAMKMMERSEQRTGKAAAGAIRRVAVYCRISSFEELSELQYFRNLIHSTGGCQLAGIYTDSEISDTNISGLPGFQQLMEDCRAGKIDRILTQSITRFAGNAMDSLKAAETLSRLPHPVEVKFETEHADTSDPGMHFLFQMILQEAAAENGK
jgi:site-specific DNA recombinase